MGFVEDFSEIMLAAALGSALFNAAFDIVGVRSGEVFYENDWYQNDSSYRPGVDLDCDMCLGCLAAWNVRFFFYFFIFFIFFFFFCFRFFNGDTRLEAC